MRTRLLATSCDAFGPATSCYFTTATISTSVIVRSFMPSCRCCYRGCASVDCDQCRSASCQPILCRRHALPTPPHSPQMMGGAEAGTLSHSLQRQIAVHHHL